MLNLSVLIFVHNAWARWKALHIWEVTSTNQLMIINHSYMIQISFQAWMPPLACGHLHTHLDLFTCALIVCMTFLLGVLQHMTFICYLTEYLTCLKFHLCKPKHMSFKMIFVPNVIFFQFYLFDFLFKKLSLFS